VIVSVLTLLLRAEAAASSVSLLVHDGGFATERPAYTRQPGWQAVSDLEVVGDVAFVSWYDHEAPFGRGMVSRLTSDGTRLDEIGRPVGGLSTQLVPEGSNVRLFHVVFAGNERVVRSSLFTRDGEVGPENEVARLPASPAPGGFDVARSDDGLSLLVTGPYALLLDGATIVRQTTLTGWGTCRVSPFDDGWVVTWIASGGFAMWQAFDDDLEPLGPAAAVASEVSSIALASNGSTLLYAVSGVIGLDVWELDPARGQSERVVELDISFAAPTIERVGAGRHLLAWQLNGQIEGAEIVNNEIGTAHQLVPGGGFSFVLRSWSDGIIVADSHGSCFRRICEIDVYATRRHPVDGSWTTLVSTTTGSQTAPVVAHDGERFIASWQQSGVDLTPLIAWGFANEVSKPLAVRTREPDAYQSTSPVIGAYDGHRILLSSAVPANPIRNALQGFVLDASGEPLSPVSIPIAEEAQNLTIIGGPSGWLAAWSEWNQGNGRIVGQLVAFDGSEVGGTFDIGPAHDSFQTHLGIDLSGTGFVATWVSRSTVSEKWEVLTARVSAFGQITPGNPMTESNGVILHPSLSCDLQRCLAVWSDDANGDGDYDIIGRWLDPESLTVVTDEFVIASTGNVEASPLVSRTERAWIVTWTERHPDSADARVLAARVATQSADLGVTVLVGSATFVSSRNHALSCGPDDCVSLRVKVVDDPERGRTSALMCSLVRESRIRGVRRGE